MKPAMAVVALLLGLGHPPLQAQGTAFLQDDAGDASWSADGQPVEGAATGTEGIDLQALHLVEEDAAFVLTVELDALAGTTSPKDGYQLNVSFTYEAQAYKARCDRDYALPALTPTHACTLLSLSSGGARKVADLDATFDGRWTLRVLKDDLIGESGIPALRGRELSDWRVETYRYGYALTRSGDDSTGHVYARDAMPDTGPSPSYTIALGATQDPALYMVSPDPVRYSNGEARTFVYNFTTTADLARPGTITWRAVDVPEGWQVIIPAGTAQADGPGNFSRVAIVRVPFAHEHGTDASFAIEATTDADDAVRSRMDLRVHYPAVPQPAGHHNRLYVHGADSEDPLGQPVLLPYMNTLAKDEAGRDDAPIPATSSTGVVMGTGVPPDVLILDERWQVPLNPGLLVGLLLHPGGEATLAATYEATQPMTGATAETRLQVRRQTPAGLETLILGASPTVDLGDLAAGDQASLALAFPLDPELRSIPAGAGWNLELWLQVSSAPSTTADSGRLLPGAVLTLPLLDPVDLDLGIAPMSGDVTAVLAPGNLLQIRPGLEGEFILTLQNAGAARKVHLDLVATQDWAFFASTPPEVLGQGGTEVRIGVAVPADALHGSQVDIIVSATVEGHEQPVLARMVAIADTSQGQGVEAIERSAARPKESPAPAAWLLVVALGVLAVQARGRAPR